MHLQSLKIDNLINFQTKRENLNEKLIAFQKKNNKILGILVIKRLKWKILISKFKV